MTLFTVEFQILRLILCLCRRLQQLFLYAVVTHSRVDADTTLTVCEIEK